MSESSARVLLAERVPQRTLIERAQAQGLNVDARQIQAPIARPFEVKVFGSSRDGSPITDLWVGLDVEVHDLVQGV